MLTEKNAEWVTVGKRVRAARIAGGYEKMGDLAAALELPRFGAQTLGAVERGERKLFPHEAAEIARVVDFDAAWFYGAKGNAGLEGFQESAAAMNDKLDEILKKLAGVELAMALEQGADQPGRGDGQREEPAEDEDDLGSGETG